MLTIELIKEAAARIAGHIHRTPVITSRSFNEMAGREVFFKCENLQRAGAFKIRGATNKILSLTDEEKRRGVAAFSSGNHARAVALSSRCRTMRRRPRSPLPGLTAPRSFSMIDSNRIAKGWQSKLLSAKG